MLHESGSGVFFLVADGNTVSEVAVDYRLGNHRRTVDVRKSANVGYQNLGVCGKVLVVLILGPQQFVVVVVLDRVENSNNTLAWIRLLKKIEFCIEGRHVLTPVFCGHWTADDLLNIILKFGER